MLGAASLIRNFGIDKCPLSLPMMLWGLFELRKGKFPPLGLISRPNRPVRPASSGAPNRGDRNKDRSQWSAKVGRAGNHAPFRTIRLPSPTIDQAPLARRHKFDCSMVSSGLGRG
jgi:hypothetical protein